MNKSIRTLLPLLIFSFLAIGQAFSAPSFTGDLRFRHDRQDKEGTDQRYRQRVRVRIAAKGKVDDQVTYKIQLITGSDDPVSGNQSLDSGFSSKKVNLDLMYMVYQSEKMDMNITLGKMKNPFFKPGKTELVWDGDLNLEGISLKKEFGSFFVTAAYLYAEERKTAPDTIIHTVQVGIKLDNDKFKITTALALYDYLVMKGEAGLFKSSDTFGNTSTISGSDELYDSNFAILDFALQLDIKSSDLSFFINAVRNTAVNTKHSGYLAGFSYGKKLKLKYNYRRIEADAVVGVFTDSDFHGGGTDGKGHEIAISYKLTDHQKLAVSHFMNKTAVNNGVDYQRSFLDYSIKF